MSSGLGLIFTVGGIVFDYKEAHWLRNLFISLGLFGIGASAFLSWLKRYREAQAEEAKNLLPSPRCWITSAGYKQLLSSVDSSVLDVSKRYYPDFLLGFQLNVAGSNQVPFSIRDVRINASRNQREIGAIVTKPSRVTMEEKRVVAHGLVASSRVATYALNPFDAQDKRVVQGESIEGWVFVILQAGEPSDKPTVPLEDLALTVTVRDHLGKDHPVEVPRTVVSGAIEFASVSEP